MPQRVGDGALEDHGKFYTDYSHGNVQPGSELKYSSTIYFNDTADFLGPFADESLETLTAWTEKSVAAEKAIYGELREIVGKWQEQAAITLLLQRAVEYLKAPKVKHTGNMWQESTDGCTDEISNMVYEMYIHVYEDTKYDWVLKKSVPVAWYVSWRVSLNVLPRQNGKTIASQEKKRFTDKAAAEKYIEGRKAFYEHLFYKISPPIPQEYARYFMVNGLLLPGYTVEGQEPPTMEKSAGEVLQELGGVFAQKQESPCFKLDGELTTAARQPKAPQKKKERQELR